ncbi:bacteriohemerythrin [Thiogranum longum]
MALIELEDTHKVNIPEIDSQHATLIGLVNDLHDAMTQRKDSPALDEIITALIEHTQQHFDYEEQLMLQSQYPEYPKHKEDHDRLMQHIMDLADRYRSGDLLLSFAVMVDLKAWATIHIEKSDTPLGIFLNAKEPHTSS